MPSRSGQAEQRRRKIPLSSAKAPEQKNPPVHRGPEPRPELRALAAHAEEAERREREAVEEVESLRQVPELEWLKVTYGTGQKQLRQSSSAHVQRNQQSIVEAACCHPLLHCSFCLRLHIGTVSLRRVRFGCVNPSL